MKIRSVILRAAVALSTALAVIPAGAQQPAAADSAATGKPRVFIDCERCDLDFLRDDIAWIDHVRDRAVADVHVLVTAQRTGSGGTEYTANFIGLRQFSGKQDTLSYFSRVAESEIDSPAVASPDAPGVVSVVKRRAQAVSSPAL